MFISVKTRKFSTRHLYINVCEKCTLLIYWGSTVKTNILLGSLLPRPISGRWYQNFYSWCLSYCASHSVRSLITRTWILYFSCCVYFSRSGYFQACDELQIFCSTCSPAQLAALKLARVLPISAAQCGLITKSDAERLCSLLVTEPGATRERHSSGAPSESAPPPAPGSPAPPTVAPSSPSGGGAVSPPRGDPTSFKVQHECFGDCVGVIHPQSYSSQGAKCIGKILALTSFIPVIQKAKCNPLKLTAQLWTLALAGSRIVLRPK